MASVEGLKKYIGIKGSSLGLAGLAVLSAGCGASTASGEQEPNVVGVKGNYTVYTDGPFLKGIFTADTANWRKNGILTGSKFAIKRAGRNVFSVSRAVSGYVEHIADGIGYIADRCEIVGDLPRLEVDKFDAQYLIRVQDENCIPELAPKSQ